MIAVGKKAPEFSLPADDGSTISLADLKGRKVVLFFYPKDDTPGCTTESCELRDNWSAITAAGALVLGVSPDSVASHAKFSSKFSFPFRLLADTDHPWPRHTVSGARRACTGGSIGASCAPPSCSTSRARWSTSSKR